MPEAYLVDALRTPTGKRRGSLAEVHAADLGAHVIKAVVDRNPVPAEEIDDVVFGCVDTVGPMAGNIARTCWLAAGLPLSVPGVTIDRQCGSSQQAVHFAAQAVMSGVQDVVIAGGVQTMSSVPIGSSMMAGRPLGFDDPFSGSKGWKARFGDAPVTQFNGAQMIADRWGFDREAMERFALESHERGRAAIAAGHFDRELVPLNGLEQDETTRETSLEKMAELEVLAEGGSLTAAVASLTCDGASAMLVVSEAALKRYGLKPRARIRSVAVTGSEPTIMLTGIAPACRKALKRAGMDIGDIDLLEINEAFAAAVMKAARDLDVDLGKVNVNGGAIAMGHPLGATGCIILGTLLDELERRDQNVGMASLCVGGGMGIATIIERTH